ncbi:hypothetical protein ARMGADRAFT_506578 [Armillaria gallica]|uniref:Uncharacterized protein n=1 Tax=Armillaria gallica TaxID=47427 RepID=A0A2H3DWD3_ARMGA|nr:hypothetical protein ARMGADRAFT_506578 [Armillaria gallica]
MASGILILVLLCRPRLPVLSASLLDSKAFQASKISRTNCMSRCSLLQQNGRILWLLQKNGSVRSVSTAVAYEDEELDAGAVQEEVLSLLPDLAVMTLSPTIPNLPPPAIFSSVNALARENVGVVINPTEELAIQIADDALRLSYHDGGFEARLLVGGKAT